MREGSGGRSPYVSFRAIASVNVAMFLTIGVGETQLRQSATFRCFHLLRVFVAGFVVVALQMQDAMHDQVGIVRFERFLLLRGLAFDDGGTDDEIAGDDVRAGEAWAEAAYLGGRPEQALVQLNNLKKRATLDYYARSRIEARIAAITPTVLELRRQGIRDEEATGRLSVGVRADGSAAER